MNNSQNTNKIKKICIITSVFAPYTKGGAETVVTNIANGFKNKGYQVIIITAEKWQGIKSLKPKKGTENNFIIYRYYPLNIFSYLNINNYKNKPFLRLIWHGLDMFNLHTYFVIKKILKQEKPAVVMTHMLKGLGYLTCRAVKSNNIKNIHTLHEVQLISPSGLILKHQEKNWQHTCFLTKLYQKFNKTLFNSPDVVVSSSKFLLDLYNSHSFFKNSKKIILTNPVDIDLKKITAKNEQTFYFLFLGQIEEYKGVLFLIDVFKKIQPELQSKDKVKLIIVGKGSADNKVKKAVAGNSNIEFKGYIPNEELGKIFSLTNVAIVPSLCYENSPTVIFESLAHGVPVIAARIGGIEFIEENKNGYYFEAGDEESLKKIMLHAIKNKSELEKMSTACQASVSHTGVENYIQKIKQYF